MTVEQLADQNNELRAELERVRSHTIAYDRAYSDLIEQARASGQTDVEKRFGTHALSQTSASSSGSSLGHHSANTGPSRPKRRAHSFQQPLPSSHTPSTQSNSAQNKPTLSRVDQKLSRIQRSLFIFSSHPDESYSFWALLFFHRIELDTSRIFRAANFSCPSVSFNHICAPSEQSIWSPGYVPHLVLLFESLDRSSSPYCTLSTSPMLELYSYLSRSLNFNSFTTFQQFYHSAQL